MGSVEFGFGLLCQLPEVTVANMTYMSHGKPWLTILTFRDVRCGARCLNGVLVEVVDGCVGAIEVSAEAGGVGL